MAVSKNKMVAISGGILGLGTALAASVGQKLLETGMPSVDPSLFIYGGTVVGGGVAINLLSNVAQKICNIFSEKIITKHPNDLNHDLQAAFLRALSSSLNNVIILYHESQPSANNAQQAASFIASVEKQLTDLFRDAGSIAVVNRYFNISTPAAVSGILSDLQEELNTTGLPADFIFLFNSRFTEQFQTFFSQELKAGNNNPGWVAFQKIMLEAMKSDLEAILKGQSNIEKAITELKNSRKTIKIHRLPAQKIKSIAGLLKEIDQPGRIEESLNTALKDLVAELRKDLADIRQINHHTYHEVLDLRKHIKAQQKNWVSRKMVISYTLIFGLLAVLLVLRQYYTRQPFAINVRVHGPGGPADMVLINRGSVHITYGDKTDEQPLNEKGEAYFKQIPGKYRDDSSTISITGIEGEPYRPACPGCRIVLEPGKTYYLPLAAYGLDKLYGIVVDEKSEPVEGARVFVMDLTTYTDSSGAFRLQIPASRQKRFQDITVSKRGYKEEKLLSIPPHTQVQPLDIQLKKE